MRGCCLFFVLLGLIGSIVMILFGSIFSISFNWEDWLIYLGIAIIIYLTVLVIGNSLNKQFNDLVDNFIIGEKEKLKKKQKNGNLLICLVMVNRQLINLHSSRGYQSSR